MNPLRCPRGAKHVAASLKASQAIHLVVVSWQTGLTALPIALEAYLTADIQSAETYLKTLKRMIQSQQSAQIHR